jgi:hypothetical protein
LVLEEKDGRMWNGFISSGLRLVVGSSEDMNLWILQKVGEFLDCVSYC